MNYTATVTKTHDSGLANYMTGIYTFMAAGLGLTALTAFGVAYLPGAFELFMGGPQKWLFIFAPLLMVLAMSFGLERMSAETLRMMFFGYAALMGVSMSIIFLVFTGVSIVSTFLVTTIAFASLSIYGLTTKRNLSAMGTFLLMGLIGLIVATVVNLFLASSALAFAVNVIGVLIFAGLTAYDTQNLQQMYLSGSATDKLSIMGALSLYLNFINLFQFLLSFLGQQNE